MSTTNNTRPSSIASLVENSMSPEQKQATAKPLRFIVNLTVDQRVKLEKLAADFGCGQIKLASQLLAIAIDEARTQYDKAVADAKKTTEKTPAAK